jgi:hypothetical protein
MVNRSGVKRGRIEKRTSVTFMDVFAGKMHVTTERKTLPKHLQILEDVRGSY